MYYLTLKISILSCVQMSKDELRRIKAELGNTRKDKFAYQTKVGQLKGALKATLQQNKVS